MRHVFVRSVYALWSEISSMQELVLVNKLVGHRPAYITTTKTLKAWIKPKHSNTRCLFFAESEHK